MRIFLRVLQARVESKFFDSMREVENFARKISEQLAHLQRVRTLANLCLPRDFCGSVLDVRTRGPRVRRLLGGFAREICGTWPLFFHFVKNSFFFSELRPGKNHFSDRDRRKKSEQAQIICKNFSFFQNFVIF
jgi:hypothetical protein